MARSVRLREYEVDISTGVTVTMKLNPEFVAERGDSRRVREVKAAARPANKSRQTANKSTAD